MLLRKFLCPFAGSWGTKANIVVIRTMHSILFVMTSIQYCVMKRKASRSAAGEKEQFPEPSNTLTEPPRAVIRD